MTEPSDAHSEETERVVIRDKRRVTPPGERGKHKAEHKPKHKRPDHAAGGAPGSMPAASPPPRPVAETAGPGPVSGPGPVPSSGPVSGPGPGPAPGAAPGPGPAPGPGGADVGSPGGFGAELEALRAALDERTRDLQRVTAEYANYRKRVERDRALVGEQATRHVLSALLPVLDDLDRAREHGELVEGVAAVAEQLVATTTKFGLTAFGEKGDPFDPTRHEAVAHLTSDEVTQPTCIDILRRGYLLGDRLLRPAMVAVAEPAEPS